MNTNISDLSEKLSLEKEREVARTFAKRFQWEMLTIGLGQALVWLSMWYLVVNGHLSLFAGFVVSTFCACLAYLPSHEAQHGNFSRGNKKLQWIDSLVGNVSLITLMYPYPLMKVTHMKHHAYTNDSEKDIDYDIVSCKNPWEVFRYTSEGPKKYKSFYEVHKNDQNFADKFEQGVLISWMQTIAQFVLVVLFPLETLFLWFLPRKIGTFYTAMFFFVVSTSRTWYGKI